MLIPILPTNVTAFRLILTEDAFNFIREERSDSYAFGVVENGMPVAAGEDTLLPFVTALGFDIVDTGKDYTLSVREAFEADGMKKILSAKEKGEIIFEANDQIVS